MDLPLPLLLVAALLVGVMGFAIQRGATCMVVAVDEILTHRRATTLLALGEAGLWVGGLLAIAMLGGARFGLPHPPPDLGYAIVGGMVLGLGSALNGACVLGTIARIGAGQWAFALTPLGFLAGCALLFMVAPPPQPSPLAAASGLATPWPFLAALALLVPVRLVQAVRAHSIGLPVDQRWTPHAATTVIAVAFVLLLLIAGPWSWTDAVSELARTGMASAAGQRFALFALLVAGAIVGGRLMASPASAPLLPARILRCFFGGALIAAGSLLIPGSNDGLLLLGLPLFWINGLAALAAMGITIAVALLLARRLSGPRALPG